MPQLIKSESEIANEIRRRAQAKANERRDPITIRTPAIHRLREPGPFNCWWSLEELAPQGGAYLSEAAAEVAIMWRLAPPE
jgi:hypothetical protein